MTLFVLLAVALGAISLVMLVSRSALADANGVPIDGERRHAARFARVGALLGALAFFIPVFNPSSTGPTGHADTSLRLAAGFGLGLTAALLLGIAGGVLGRIVDAATTARPRFAANDADAAASRPSRGLVAGLAVLILVVAVGGYAWVGSPRLLPVTPDAPPGPGASADAQVATLQARAEQHPDEAGGWFQAAHAQLELNHPAEAAQDYRRALALRPKDADLMADLADVLAVVQQGHLDGEPIQLVERALVIAPDHVKALALKGSYAMTQRDYRTGLMTWEHALRVAQPDDPIAVYLRQQLDDMREMARRAGAGASAPAEGAAVAPQGAGSTAGR